MTVSLTFPQPKTRKPAVGATIAGTLRTAWTWRRNMERRAELRRLLERADDRMLADIGLTRASVVDEAGKPFWRI